jgi:hypothetical protein
MCTGDSESQEPLAIAEIRSMINRFLLICQFFFFFAFIDN